MRFILKTSPLLSKCVDKQFIRTAIKNIEYQDISKLELKIAEQIISRFDQIRKAVRESRKHYKQNKIINTLFLAWFNPWDWSNGINKTTLIELKSFGQLN